MRSGEVLDGKVDSHPRSIYVIEIDPKWYEDLGPTIPSGVTCLYVGQSKSPPKKRFKQHRRGHTYRKKGGESAAKVFRNIAAARSATGAQRTLVEREDAWLRHDLMRGIEPVVGEPAALELELETAERLRAMGYHVFGPKSPSP